MSVNINIITGLGNPGERYSRTLHNAGFWFVDVLAGRFDGSFKYEKRFDADICRIHIADLDIWLAKPKSYMNHSGGPIKAMLDYYRLSTSNLLIAHDDIDLSVGVVRLKQGGGHGGHNGLRNVMAHCDSNFLRLRLGVGHPGDKEEVTNYVLKKTPSAVETEISLNINDAADALPLLLSNGLDAAMKRLHTKD